MVPARNPGATAPPLRKRNLAQRAGCPSRRITFGGGYTASGSSAIITDAGVLSVYVATTVNGASTLTGTATIGGASPLIGTVKIGVGHTHGGTSATNTDAGVLSVNGAQW